MTERPILFSAPMVRAILEGRKTQTRRALKKQPPVSTVEVGTWHHPDPRPYFYASDGGSILDWCRPCPYGAPGERLWVRETFCPIYPQDPQYNGGRPIEYDYRATYKHGDRSGDLFGLKKAWKPSIHMPRQASRITLEITDVRVQRLQNISEADAQSEGIFQIGIFEGEPLWWYRDEREPNCGMQSPHSAFINLWDSINGSASVRANPWVWAITFKVVKPEESENVSSTQTRI